MQKALRTIDSKMQQTRTKLQFRDERMEVRELANCDDSPVFCSSSLLCIRPSRVKGGIDGTKQQYAQLLARLYGHSLARGGTKLER